MLIQQYEDQSVVAEARRQFDDHISGRSQISPDLKGAVYLVVARHGDEKTYQQMMEVCVCVCVCVCVHVCVCLVCACCPFCVLLMYTVWPVNACVECAVCSRTFPAFFFFQLKLHEKAESSEELAKVYCVLGYFQSKDIIAQLLDFTFSVSTCMSMCVCVWFCAHVFVCVLCSYVCCVCLCVSPNNLAVVLGCDWFQPYKHITYSPLENFT